MKKSIKNTLFLKTHDRLTYINLRLYVPNAVRERLKRAIPYRTNVILQLQLGN